MNRALTSFHVGSLEIKSTVPSKYLYRARNNQIFKKEFQEEISYKMFIDHLHF